MKNMLAQLFIVKCLLHTLSSHFVIIIQRKSKKHLNLHFNYKESENEDVGCHRSYGWCQCVY